MYIQANLSNANLKYAKLTKTNLINANLSGVDLAGAELICTILEGVDLSQTSNAVTVANLYPDADDNPDLNLLVALKKSSSDLYFHSESDYPYEVFLWDVDNQGYFTKDILQLKN